MLGNGARSKATSSTGVAAAHSLFSRFGGMIALAAGGSYPYKTDEEAGSGYSQLFLGDVEFVVTDR